MKVLLFADYAAHTGFARAAEAFAKRWVEAGHELSVLALNYRGDAPPSRVRLFMPNSKEPKDNLGLTRVVEVLAEAEPDVVVILNDPFIAMRYIFGNDKYDPEHVLLRYRPLVTYQPRDGDNPPLTWDTLREIKGASGNPFPVSRQVAMSKFGQEQMPGSDLVYHGVETDLFRPASRAAPLFTSGGVKITTKSEAKAAFGYDPDGFLVLRVDRNSLRKDFASTWKALMPVMKRHPDIQVHFHCSGQDAAGGVQMPELWSRDLETAMRFHLPGNIDTFQGWPVEDLVALYNAADLFVTTSMGEGYGLTIGESLACGTPVIAQNFSAIPEVVGPGGMLIEPAYTVTAPGGQDQRGADIAAFSEAIEHLYLNEGFRKRYGRAGREHVVNTFNWDVEAAKFEKILLETVEQTELVSATA